MRGATIARRPWALCAGLCVAAFVVLSIAGAGQSFFGDELSYMNRLATEPLFEVAFDPPGRRYVLPVPLALYKLGLVSFGADSHLPFELVARVLHLVIGALIFALVRPATGTVWALALSALFLFLGSTGDVTLSALRFPMLMAMGAALGALVLIRRGERRADAGAGGLLALALFCHPVSFAFFAVVAVHALGRGKPERWRSWTPERRRGVLVVVAPLLVWLIVTRVLTQGSGASPTLARVTELPEFALESLRATAAAMVGLYKSPAIESLPDGRLVYWVPTAALLVLLVLRLRRRPLPQVGFWAAIAGLLAAWTITVLQPDVPAASGATRYLYPAVALLLIALAEGMRGLPAPRGRAAVALASVIVAALALEAVNLADWQQELQRRGDLVRAEMGAAEIAKPTRERIGTDFSYRPSGRPVGIRSPERYYEIAERFGSPAMEPEEIANASGDTRLIADNLLAWTLRLELEPTSKPPVLAGKAAARPGERSARVPGEACVVLDAGGRDGAVLELPPGGVALAAVGSPATVRIGRFSDVHPFLLGRVRAGAYTRLRTPSDGVETPWSATVGGRGSLTACGLG